MTYAFFVKDTKRGAEEWLKAVSLALVTPESQLTSIDVWSTDYKSVKPLTNKSEVVAGYIACIEAKVAAVSLVKFKKDIKTDKYLLSSFKDAYLGSIQGKMNKEHLLTRAQHTQTIAATSSLADYLLGDLKLLRDHNPKANISEKELKELKLLQSTYAKSIKQWVLERNKNITLEIKKLPKFLEKNF